MTIAIWLLQDSIRNWSSWIAGLYYVRNCLEGLAALRPGDAPRVVVFVPDSIQSRLLESTSFRDAPWLEVVPVDETLLRDRAGHDRLYELVAGKGCDLLFPAITPPVIPFDGKLIGWITDYQHKHYPEFFSADERAARDRLFSFLTATCDRVVCSSASVQRDLNNYYPHATDRGFVLRFRTQPPPSTWNVAPTAALAKLGVTQPYVYLPYQFWKHKNHKTAFEAWKLLHSRGCRYRLVCSGATQDARFPGYFEELQTFIKENQLSDHVQMLGLVDRDLQWQLYRAAKLVLQPSLFEGWSTSVEEARSVGKTVVLSDIPVHREQLDGCGEFFAPLDPTSLADAVCASWDQSPAGYDAEREQAAREANPQRMREFGSELLNLFRKTQAETRASVAPHVLPLYLFMQEEADARLEVIQGLAASQAQRGLLRRFWPRRAS